MQSRDLILFAPLPPMRTGIADYTAELLPLLARHYRCTVVAEDGIPDLQVPLGVTLLRLAEYEAEEPVLGRALHLYQLGNNTDHIYMLPVMARHPGVVVLHDPGLHHLLDCTTAALGDADGYCAAIEAEYGAPGRLLANQWRAHELRDRQMIYGMPMLRQLLGPARHVIVHSQYARHKVLREAPDTPVTVAPHQYCPPADALPPAAGRAALRARLGIGAHELVFLSIGFVSHIKRVDLALRALARIARRLPPFRYVIAGAIKAEELDVAALAARLGLADRVVLTGYLPEADFFPAIDAADIVINLRYPVGGETSGTLVRAMGRGACVVVVDHGPFAELPDGAAIRLPWGPDFEAVLADSLLRLAVGPPLRAAVGAHAAQEIARCNDATTTLAAYRQAIDAAAAAADPPWRCGCDFTWLPPQRRPGSGAALWQQLGAVPQVGAGCAALAVGDAHDLAALSDLGVDPVAAGVDWLPEQAASRSLDLLFLRIRAGDTLADAPDLAARLNRVLRFDGVAVLCLCGVDPAQQALAGRAGGDTALRTAGWRVGCAAAAPPPRLDSGPPGTDELVWQLTKVSEFIAGAPLTAAA